MASMTLHVPTVLVEAIYDEFRRHRDVKFDVLESRPVSDRSPSQLEAANVVCAIDTVLAALPWKGIGSDEAIDVTGQPTLLREIAHGALLCVADQLMAACHRGSAESLDGDEVASQMYRLSLLLGFHARASRAH